MTSRVWALVLFFVECTSWPFAFKSLVSETLTFDMPSILAVNPCTTPGGSGRSLVSDRRWRGGGHFTMGLQMPAFVTGSSGCPSRVGFSTSCLGSSHMLLFECLYVDILSAQIV